MLQEDDVLPSQRCRRLTGEGKGIERNARGAPRVSLAPKTPCPSPFKRKIRLTSSNRASIFVSTSCEERHNIPFWLYTWRVNRKQQSSTFPLG